MLSVIPRQRHVYPVTNSAPRKHGLGFDGKCLVCSLHCALTDDYPIELVPVYGMFPFHSDYKPLIPSQVFLYQATGHRHIFSPKLFKVNNHVRTNFPFTQGIVWRDSHLPQRMHWKVDVTADGVLDLTFRLDADELVFQFDLRTFIGFNDVVLDVDVASISSATTLSLTDSTLISNHHEGIVYDVDDTKFCEVLI